LKPLKFIPTKRILLSKIVFDDNNPNVMSKETNEALEHVVTKYGYAVDPWLNKLKNGKYLVIDGKHRIKLLMKKGIKSVMAKIFEVSYVEVQMLRQVANKLRGEHDKAKDAEEFKAIFEGRLLEEFAAMLGQPVEDFQRILEKKFDMDFGIEEEEIPEKPKKPKAKLGEIYQLGKHRIMCGDATKDIPKLIKKLKINILLTDPPYGMNLDTDWTDAKTNLKFLKTTGAPKHGNRYEKVIGDDVEFDPSHLLKYKEVFLWGADYYSCNLPKDGSWLVWDKRVDPNLDDVYGSNFELCWSKTKHKRDIIRVKWAGIFGTETQDIKKRIHPTQKPIEVFTWILNKFTKKNHAVLDCYLGSGSTLIACEKSDRICYGMELDPGYIDVIITRWENYTGKKAKKIIKN